MGKVFWTGGTLLSPVPPVMVTCGTIESPNIITIGWTGIVNTKPPMTYISVRPERYSYDIIKQNGEFAINLTTSKLVKKADFCGVKSGENVDKFGRCGLHAIPAKKIRAPLIEESPLSLECVVKQVISLGSHDMFLAEIVGADIDERYIDSKGKLNLQQCGLAAYAHGEYFALGRKLGDFGFSVRKKKNKHKSLK